VLAGAGAGSPANAPSLRLLRAAPVVVQGISFQPAEGVILTLGPGRRAVTRTRADENGSFTAMFNRFALRRCTGYTITAAGTMGSHATLKRPPLTGCLPGRG
jgi:hypothetical protein